MKSRESMEFDIVIVGAGPAGLSAAIQLAKLDNQLNICIIEKGREVGDHSLSGAVLEPTALNELIPNWKEDENLPVFTETTLDKFLFLTEKKSFRLPTPPEMRNHGNYIISLSRFCRWLAMHAEKLGVNVFPGFAAVDVIYKDHKICGIITGDQGIDKMGNPTPHYQPGLELLAKQVLIAEGCRGSLTRSLMERFQLNSNNDPQTYGLGFKELWEVPEELHQKGLVIHSVGWPLDYATYGGSFVYHFNKNLVGIGFVVGLDYKNPYLNPYEEFQRFKTHPFIKPLLEKSQRIAYGARTLIEGGFQSLPKLTFPGGMLIGDAAGFLNVPKIKGIHTAMKSGMIAAESVYSLLKNNNTAECTMYSTNIKSSRIWQELKKVRNIRPGMNKGLLFGLLYAAFDTYILRGNAPWTFHNHADHLQLKFAKNSKKIDYPKHDNKITFDLMSSVYLTNTYYDENQPCHLKLIDPDLAISVNFALYDSPEQRYCPAGVYEILYNEKNNPYLQINGANCIHCKACDIKDPKLNIVWTPPEGGSGPQYAEM